MASANSASGITARAIVRARAGHRGIGSRTATSGHGRDDAAELGAADGDAGGNSGGVNEPAAAAEVDRTHLVKMTRGTARARLRTSAARPFARNDSWRPRLAAGSLAGAANASATIAVCMTRGLRDRSGGS
jgi:hypothetical protein